MAEESSELLRQYAQERSQEAFAQIVRRYVDMVYASARRQVRDAELAQDVTQAVFIVLARKAASVPAERPLAAWLLRTTAYCASNARRAREHRELHERSAAEMARDMHDSAKDSAADWEQLAPLLDEGLNKLGSAERDALVLKYFEKKSLRQVGEALGISEEAATKRVSRAVERLRVFFHRRGAAVSIAALSMLLAAESAKAAPIGLAGTISAGGGAAAAGTGAASVAKGAMIVMAAQKVKVAAIAVGAVAVAVGGVFMLQSARTRVARTAIVPIPPVVQESLTKSRWALMFASGTQVEILGICDPDSKTDLWWAADGSPALAPRLQAMSPSNLQLFPGEAKRRIVLRLSGKQLAAKNFDLAKELDPPLRGESVLAISPGAHAQDYVVDYVVAVPPGVNSASLKLKLKGGKKPAEEVTVSNLALMPTGKTTDVRVQRSAATRPALTRAGS